jgi:peptidyl-prolyl cis-trans isomerase C
MKLRMLAIALATVTVPSLVLAQAAKLPTKEPAKAAAPANGPLATVNGVAIPRQRAELIARQQISRGAQDSEGLRAQIREVLINNEVVMQEATRAGVAKRADVTAQIEQARHDIVVNAYLNDYMTKNPISDAEVQAEYERAKQQTGSTEYKARHILVESEDQAKKIIGDIKKGAKFEEQAQKHSIDASNKDRGGDLDWNVPGVYDKTFSDAMVKLEKGKMTEAPVRTRFGYHVIRLDDVRAVTIPPLADVKPRIQQRLAQIKIEKLVQELRAKAKIE